MTEWWESLDTTARVFWGIAIGFTVFQLLLFVVSLFGGDDLDHDPGGDAHHGAGDGLKFLSLRVVVAFFIGFGWTGGVMLERGHGPLAATLAGSAAGVVFMGVIFLIMRGMMSLRDEGTLDYRNAVGESANVYVTIPGRRQGRGQVEVLIQSRLITAHAVTDDEADLSPNSKVNVLAVEGANVLVVQSAN